MYALAILLPSAGVVVILLMLIELRHWRAGRRLITARQLRLRMVGGGVLLVLLAGIFAGSFVLRLHVAHERPGLFLVWWMGCLLIAIVLMFIALADMRQVEERHVERQNDLWREYARTLAERLRRERGDTTPGDRDEPR